MAAADRAARHATDAHVAAWALEWSTWYGQYAARAAEQSEGTSRLYRQVADAVARAELPPNALQDMLASFTVARSAAYAERLAELIRRFFSRLVETAAHYSREMAAAVMPGVPIAPPLPELGSSDPHTWFRQLTEYSHSLSAHFATSYQSFLDRVAAGQVDSANLKEAASNYLDQRFPEYLRQLGRLYFDLLTDLNDLRASGEQEYLADVLASARPGRAESMSVDLFAPATQRASARLSIANTRDAPARIHTRITEIRRADGIGPAVSPSVAVTPQLLHLSPAEEGSITLALDLDTEVFAPDTLYVAALFVSGHDEAPLEIPLRIMATSASPPTG